MPDAYGNPTEAERRMAGYAPNVMAQGSTTPVNTTFTYNNGRHFAGTNVPMSDQAYALLTQSGQPLATDRDVSGQSMGAKLGNAARFELDRAGNLVKNVLHNPGQALTGGIDPIGTKIGNAITGSHNRALVGQFGGATSDDFNRYEQQHGFGSLGAARALSHSADAIAGIAGAAGAAHGLSQAYQGLTGGTNAAPTQTYRGGANLDYVSNAPQTAATGANEALPEVVVNGTRAAGLTPQQLAVIGGSSLGALGGYAAGGANGAPNTLANTGNPAASFASSQTGGSAGQLANSGGIGGGAGTGGTTGGALGNASGVANYVGGTGGNVAGGFGSGSGGLWGNLLTLGGSLYNTYQQQQGAKSASRASQAGDAAGLAELRRQYDQSRADQAPWLQAGTAALGRLQDPNAFTQSPGYAFARDEALNGAQNSAAATGGLFSGNAGRALQDRAANVASLDYNNWFNQQSNLAGLGQTSAQSLGSIGQNSANGVANLLGQQANARASGIVDQTNATTNGLNDVGQWYGNWLRQRQLGGG